MKSSFVVKNKERIIFLLISLCVLVICISFSNLSSFFMNYGISHNKDTPISENMLFVVNDYHNVDVSLLSFKDPELTYDTETGVLQSFYIGEYCVSLTSMLIESGGVYNKNSLVELLDNIYTTLEKEEDRLIDYSGDNYAYIMSKNTKNKQVFVDFITPSPTIMNSVMYSRFVLQNVNSLDLDLKETDYVYLKNILPEIIEVLNLNIEISVLTEVMD